MISKEDIRIIKDIQGLKEAQRKRLVKYMKALKQIEELEGEDYGTKRGNNDR